MNKRSDVLISPTKPETLERDPTTLTLERMIAQDDVLVGQTLPEHQGIAVGHMEEETLEDYEQYFPTKLHYLMHMLEQDGLSHICGFQPHGRAFLVRDKKRFVEELLPKWFNQRLWASFQRQLNIYEFKRISTGRDKGAYYHPYFLKDRRELCRFIKRVKIKGAGPRKPSRPEMEPDFYKMRPLALTNPEANSSLQFGGSSIGKVANEEGEEKKAYLKNNFQTAQSPISLARCEFTESYFYAPQVRSRNLLPPCAISPPSITPGAAAGTWLSRDISPRCINQPWLETIRDNNVTNAQLREVMSGAVAEMQQQSLIEANSIASSQVVLRALTNSLGIVPNHSMQQQDIRVESTRSDFLAMPLLADATSYYYPNHPNLSIRCQPHVNSAMFRERFL